MGQNGKIFNAAKRLVAKIVHKAKSLFFGNEIALCLSRPGSCLMSAIG